MTVAGPMADVVEGVRSAYNRIAEAYAVVNSGAMPDALIRLAHKLLADMPPRARVLDVGCGVGRDMGWFEARGVQMVGIDLSPAMLSHARRLTASPLLLMDMRHIAFRDACFDGAWCCASLLHLPKADAPGALQAIHRVLKPGGMLMVSVQEGDCEAWEGGYVEGVERFFARYRRAGMEAMLEEAGFLVCEVDLEHAHRDWLSLVCVARHS